MSCIQFSQVWQSSTSWNNTKLEELYSGKQELEKITENIKNATPENIRAWRKARLAKLQSNKIWNQLFYYIFKCLHAAFSWLGLARLAKQCYVLKQHKSCNISEIRTIETLKDSLIASVRNVHQIDTSEVYLHEDIDSHRLFHGKGLCRGMSKWFAYLYLKSQQAKLPAQESVVAVAKLFEEGAPIQAALIQSCISKDVEKPFISSKFIKKPNIKFVCNPAHCATIMIKHFKKIEDKDNLIQKSNESAFEITDISQQSLQQQKLDSKHSKALIFQSFLIAKKAIEKFNNISSGTYSVTMLKSISPEDGGHSATYIKLNKNLGYIFDPNVGVIQFNGPKSPKRAFSYIYNVFKGPFLLRECVLAG